MRAVAHFAEDRAAAHSRCLLVALNRRPIRFSRVAVAIQPWMNGLFDGELGAAAPAKIKRRGTSQLTELVCRARQHVSGCRPERSRVSLLTVELVVAMGLVHETALMADGSC